MKKFWWVLVVVALIALTPLLLSCQPAPEAKPPAAPQAVAPPPVIGMEIGERYHDIHVNKLELKCEFCHVTATATYNDPLAQVSNLADRRACLSCHKEGSEQPFYGEAWGKAKVK